MAAPAGHRGHAAAGPGPAVPGATAVGTDTLDGSGSGLPTGPVSPFHLAGLSFAGREVAARAGTRLRADPGRRADPRVSVDPGRTRARAPDIRVSVDPGRTRARAPDIREHRCPHRAGRARRRVRAGTARTARPPRCRCAARSRRRRGHRRRRRRARRPAARAAPDHRHRQPEGWRGQDHDRGEPRCRPGGVGPPRPGGRPRPPGQRVDRARASTPATCSASIYDVLMHDTPALDAVEPTSLKNLFVIPATLDLAGAEIELVPAFSRELKLKRALDAVRTEYDVVLIDCPPSLGLLTVNGLAAADDVIVPIQCEYYALEGLGPAAAERRAGALEPQRRRSTSGGSSSRCTTPGPRLAEQVETEVREHFGAKVYKTVVPRTVRLAEAPSFGQPMIVFDSDVARCVGVPEPGERGERWRDAADWVRGSGPSSPRRNRGRGSRGGRPRRAPAGLDQAEPVPTAGPLRRGGAGGSSPTRSARSACSSRSSCVPAGDDEYELIAGERRWRAARRVGLQTIPALVRETDDAAALEQALVENVHRDRPQPARGGRRLPAAHRGLRAHPRRRRGPRRPEPRHGDATRSG